MVSAQSSKEVAFQSVTYLVLQLLPKLPELISKYLAHLPPTRPAASTFMNFCQHYHHRVSTRGWKLNVYQFRPGHFSFWELGPGAQVNWEWIKREAVFKCKTPNSNLMPLKYIVAGLIRVNPKFESASAATVSCEWPDWRVVTHLPPCHQVKNEIEKKRKKRRRKIRQQKVDWCHV